MEMEAPFDGLLALFSVVSPMGTSELFTINNYECQRSLKTFNRVCEPTEITINNRIPAHVPWVWTELADWQPALWLDTFWQLINFVLTFNERRERRPGKVLKHLWRDQRKFSNSARERATLKSIEASTIVCKSLPIADSTSTSSSASFLPYVVWNNCICSLLDWCTLFVQHVYCFSSWRQSDNHPFVRRSSRITCVKAFGENRAQPQTRYLSLSLEIIISRIYCKNWIKTWSMYKA